MQCSDLTFEQLQRAQIDQINLGKVRTNQPEKCMYEPADTSMKQRGLCLNNTVKRAPRLEPLNLLAMKQRHALFPSPLRPPQHPLKIREV